MCLKEKLKFLGLNGPLAARAPYLPRASSAAVARVTAARLCAPAAVAAAALRAVGSDGHGTEPGARACVHASVE
jgi:hypothetical protein